MFKRLLFLLGFLIFFSHVLAQGFFVFDASGPAFVKYDKTEKQLARKNVIEKSQVLVVKENASVILFRQSDGVPLTVKTAGHYNFSKLMQLADESKPNVTSYFLEYCKEEILKGHDYEINKGQGVVSRGRDDDNPMLLPPDSSLIIEQSITFLWQKFPKTRPVFFIITDDENNEIIKLSVADTSLILYPFSSGLKAGKNYYWMITQKEFNLNDAVKYSFKIPTADKIKEVQKNFAELKKTLKYSEENNAIFLVQFFEKNHLYTEAYEIYQSAIKKFPDNTILKDNYSLFLTKTGL